MMTAKQQSNFITLSSLLDGVVSIPAEYNVEIKNLVLDSRQVKSGDVFIAINGEGVNGFDYIESAISSGAIAIIWDAKVEAVPFAWSEFNNKVPLIAIQNLRQHLGQFANDVYSTPSEKLNIVAVTGTNGKTSCVNFIAQALGDETPCGLIGTLGTGIYPNISVGTHTTPDVLAVHKTLAQFVEGNAKHAAIEVSSHALAQGRVDGVQIDVAIYTNLTQDHLDYHGTMDAYLEEKAKLFKNTSLKTAIVNINDPHGIDIIKAAKGKSIITYGFYQDINTPDVYASDVKYYADRTEFVLNINQGSVLISSSLVGDFNVSNVLAVCAYLQVLGLSLTDIADRIENVIPVVGRMQKIKADGLPIIIVDYAHTPDALEHVLKTLSEQFDDRLTCVFGCGGERDSDKRQQMGKVADTYANSIVITNDNPRKESAKDIVKQIEQGIHNKNKIIVELDRKKAISKAIEITNDKGCVLVAGKGHENYQIIGKNKFEFNDVAVVKELLSRD